MQKRAIARARCRTIGLFAITFAILLAGCSSSDTGSTSNKKLDVTWFYTGPRDDGGYNVEMSAAMKAMGQVPGVTTRGIYNLPYSEQATQVINQAIANGSNVLVDTLGLGTLLTNVCKQHPQVFCYSAADPAPQPTNSHAFWAAEWNLGYISGVAAGLMTKSNTVGFLAPVKYPTSVTAVNTYAMGCQSVNPECRVRVIFINSYYDPPASAQATNSLINAGADVIRNYVDDPSFCQVAAKRDVYTVGEYHDFNDVCPSVNITSTTYTHKDFFRQQAKQIQNGSFRTSGSNPTIVQLTKDAGGPHLGKWGTFVPSSVRDKVTKVYDEIVAGKNYIVGPLNDQTGKLRFGAGEAVPQLYMMSKWNWFVPGVITSG
jgi:basic membrane protein A and related proteins